MLGLQFGTHWGGEMMRTRFFLALLILLIGAFTRLYQIEYTEFSGDEGELSRMALDFVHGEWITKGLFSSQGVYHPPMMVYVVAIPYAISSHPLVAVILVAFWNLIGLAVLYRLVGRTSSSRAAAFATLAYAVSPWAVVFSHKIFPQDIHTPFFLISLWLGLVGFREGKKWAQVLSLPCFLIAPQIHLAGLTLIPLYGYFLWLGRQKISWGAMLAGVGLAGLTLLPFVLDLSAQDIEQYRALVLERKTESGLRLDIEASRRMANLATGLDMDNYFTNSVVLADFEEAAAPPPKILWAGLCFFLLVGVGGIWQKRTRWLAPLLLGWILLPVATTSTGLFYPLYHYLNLILPALFWLMGVGMAWVAYHLPYQKMSRPFFYGLLTLIFVTQTVWLSRAVNYAATHYLGSRSYGQTLAHHLPIREHLLHYENILLVGAGVNSNLRIWEALLYDAACVREISLMTSTMVVLPDEPFVVSYPDDAQANVTDGLVKSIYTSGKLTQYQQRVNVTPDRVFEFDSAPVWTGAPLIPVDAPAFDNGARLTGYNHVEGLLILAWELRGNPDENYMYFVHYIDANGNRIGQLDTDFYPSRYWCDGDNLILWIYNPLPESTIKMRVGLYALTEDGGYSSSTLQGQSETWVEIMLNQ